MDHDLVPGSTEAQFEENARAKPEVSVPVDPEPPTGRGRSALGTILLFLGIGLLGLLLIDPGELPISMPRSWYVDRTLWVAGGLISLGTGWYLLRDSETPAGEDRGAASRRAATTRAAEALADGLGPAGRRFSRLALYT